MTLSQPATTGSAFKQLLYNIAGEGSIRGVRAADGTFLTSIFHYIEKVCEYKEGASSARSTWLGIKTAADDEAAKFHAEAKAIVAGS